MQSNALHNNAMLHEFQEEFGMAIIGIKLNTRLNRIRRLQEGRQLQRWRWEKMGHKFVFTGLDGFIVTGKGNET